MPRQPISGREALANKKTSFIIHKFTNGFQTGGKSIFDALVEGCIIFLIVFTPLTHGAVEPWSTAVLQVISALCLLFWCAGFIRNGRPRSINLPAAPFIFLFILYACLQSLFSIQPFNKDSYFLPGTVYAWATHTEILKITAYSLVFFCAVNAIKTRRQVIRIMSIIICTGLVMSIFFLMHYFNVPAPGGLINPDHFAGYLGMIIPLAIGFLLKPSQDRHRDAFYAKRSLLFYIIAVMGAGLFFTMSRGGMLSFILALVLMACLTLKKKAILDKASMRTLLLIAIIIVLIIAWLGAAPVLEKLLSIKVEIVSLYFGGRLPIWRESLNIIGDFPLFGTGLGTFGNVFPKYQITNILDMHFSHVHGDYLELLCDTGIAGIALMLVAVISAAVSICRKFFRCSDTWQAAISIGLLGSIICISLHSITDFNLHIPGNAVLFVILLALLFVVLRLDNKKRNKADLAPRALTRPELSRGRPLPPLAGEGKATVRLTWVRAREQTLFTSRIVSLWEKISRMRSLLSYSIILLLSALYIIAVIRPAFAYHYYVKAVSIKPQNSSWEKNDINFINKAISLDPGNSSYHYYLGKIYYNKYVQDQNLKLQTGAIYALYAVDEFKKAIGLDPWERKYRQSMGWAYGQLYDLSCKQDSILVVSSQDYLEKAILEFENAIELQPNSPYAYRAYALWLLYHPSKENINKGLSEYRRAIALKHDLIIEAIGVYKNVAKKSFRFGNLILEMDNDSFLSLSDELKKKNFTKEAELVLKYGLKILKEPIKVLEGSVK